ncbi:MAG: FtsX-like permease family protein [Acidobacteria bacterium]|nr:FtsX-like permease family protein [Acidobacteriota bacterium]
MSQGAVHQNRGAGDWLERLSVVTSSIWGILMEAPAEHARIAGRDIKAAWSGVLKEPLSSAIIVGTMALTLGANATLIGIVDQLLMQLPRGVENAYRVVRVYGKGYWTALTRSWPDYLDLRDKSSAFSSVAAFQAGRVPVGREALRKLREEAITPNYFKMLGVKMELGRVFDETARAVAVISHSYWLSEFGGNRDAVGERLQVGGLTHTIVGVAPKAFTGVDPAETMVWTPLGELKRDRGNYGAVNVIGRLRDGLTLAQADLEANRANQQGLREDGLKADGDVMQLGAVSITQGPQAPQEIQVSKWLALAAIVVMLAGWLNVAQLLTARAVRRSRETAIHLALGASRMRLMRQWVSESLIFATVGGIAALLMLATLRQFVYRLLLPDLAMPGWSLGWRELGITAVLTLLSGVLTGWGPAWHAIRGSVITDLKQTGRHGSQRGSRLRRGLVMVQVAMTVVVLVAAGLFLQSLDSVLRIDPGFDLDHLMVVHLDSKWSGQQVRLAERARQLPGVVAAGLAHSIPGESAWRTRFYLDGRDPQRFYTEGGGIVNLLSTFVDPQGMQALGLQLRQGRWFRDADHTGSEPVAIVNEQLVRELWPREEALGKCLHLMKASAPCTRVVGVVNATRVESWFKPAPAQYYVPLAQPVRQEEAGGVLVRTKGNPAQLVGVVEKELQALVPAEAFVTVRPLQEVIEPVVRPWRLGATVLTGLGSLALLIALVGVFGLLSYLIAQRAQEWSIRQAMGATPMDIARRVLMAMLHLVFPGLIVGAVMAFAASRFIASLLYGVDPEGWFTYGAATMLVLGLASLASVVPMWRATRLDLLRQLREE